MIGKVTMAVRPGLELSEKDLRRARCFNRLLSWIPRFKTGHRWNARLVQSLVTAWHKLRPDLKRMGSRVSIITLTGSLSIRVTHPRDPPRALVIHFHGGAWVMGDARLEDRLASLIADDCAIVVAAVDFRNAADDDLARTLKDCLAAASWLATNLERFGVTHIILSGESSGAHLAVEAFFHLRSAGQQRAVIGFYSMCGAFDLEGSQSLRESSSESLLIDGPSALANLRRLRPSLPEEKRKGPVDGDFYDLPPALFIAGCLDPIADDSLEICECWRRAGGDARCILVPEAVHGFNRMPTALAAKTNNFARHWMRTLVEGAQKPDPG
ncbi:alpha/beta hydrolase [Rhizobium mesosinicum]